MSISAETVSLLKEPAKRRAWVAFQLRLRGSSFSELARELGVSRQAIGQALLVPSSHLEPAIADALGITVRQLFPDRYDASGRRLFRTREPQRNTPGGPDRSEAA